MSSARSEFISGAKAVSPMLLGIIPVNTIYGVAAISKGLSIHTALAMLIIIYANAAQLAVVELISENVGFLAITLTASILNFRYLMYSAAIAPHFLKLSKRWKFFLSYILLDEAYLLSIMRYNREPTMTNIHWYFLGVALTAWVGKLGGTVIGIFLGAKLPASWQLDFAIPLTFMALAMRAIADRATVAAGAVAALTAAIAFSLPMNLGLTLAAAIGILTGLFVESKLGGDK